MILLQRINTFTFYNIKRRILLVWHCSQLSIGIWQTKYLSWIYELEWHVQTWYWVHSKMITRVGRVQCCGTCPPAFNSLTWYESSHFTGLILGFHGAILSVVGDVSIDSEAPMVTPWILRHVGSFFRRCS
jgi:hypothetical protein